MARLLSVGFELNSLTAEFLQTTGTPTIQTGTVRSGVYAAQITSLSSGVHKGFGLQPMAAGANGPFYIRAYFRYATLPSASNTILVFNAGDTPTTTIRSSITLESDGTLKLWNGSNSTGTQIGSPSAALSANTWYAIEMLYDASPVGGSEILRARLDHVEFAAATNLTTGGAGQSFSVGGNLNAEAQTTGNWFIDDVALNDTSGSFQTSYPGSGKIIHLQPNAAGDNNAFTVAVGGTAGAANNFTRVSENTPDDATTYNADVVVDHIDDYNLTAAPSEIGASDTINVVGVGVRFAAAVASLQAAFVPRIKATSGGTVEEGTAITPNATTWKTNANGTPINHSIVLYDLPGASTTAWTKSDLDTTQIGARISTGNTNAAQISTMWLLVDFTPVAGTTTSTTTSTSTTTTSTSTSTSTTTTSTSTSTTTTSTSSTTSTSTSTTTTSTSTSTTTTSTSSTTSTSTSTTTTSTSSSTTTTSTSSTTSTSTSTTTTSTSTSTTTTSTSTSTTTTSTSTSSTTSTSTTTTSTSTSTSTTTTSTSTSTSSSTTTTSTSSTTSTSTTTTSTSSSTTTTSTSSSTTVTLTTTTSTSSSTSTSTSTSTTTTSTSTSTTTTYPYDFSVHDPSFEGLGEINGGVLDDSETMRFEVGTEF